MKPGKLGAYYESSIPLEVFAPALLELCREAAGGGDRTANLERAFADVLLEWVGRCKDYHFSIKCLQLYRAMVLRYNAFSFITLLILLLDCVELLDFTFSGIFDYLNAYLISTSGLNVLNNEYISSPLSSVDAIAAAAAAANASGMSEE